MLCPPARLTALSRALLVALIALISIAVNARGQSARDTVLEVTATTSATAPHITLNWITPGGVSVTAQQLWRRVKGSASWGSAIVVNAADTSYADATAAPGVAYEYSLQRTRTGTPTTVYGAIVAGYNVPLVESRGNVCLLVDNTMSTPLAPELTQLVNDLSADGWKVFRHDVPRQVVPASSANSADWPTRIAEQTAIRSLVQADYNSAPTVPWALLIIGRVPVPYSGNIAPDGHGDHIGAWPTDGYYADVNGTWNDTSVNNTSASDARNDNVPGDGKFDQASFPTALELMAGRVDMANMSGVPTGQTETGLLRQYLVRNHRFRRSEGPYESVERRALIDDNFGYFGGEAFSTSSWRAAIGFFGRSAGQVDALDWFGTLGTTPMLFAYSCGGGSYTSASGVGTSTTDFGRSDSMAVFTGLFGSYFGDWDVSNNFLRSPLAGTYGSLGLTCAWSGRGHVHYYHMALGETVGYGIRYTQNTSTGSGDWFQNGYVKGVQINLMGDPTLRLHTVQPVSALVATTSGANVEVSWLQSPGEVAGYHVYRATTAGGPYTRLTGSPASASDPLGSPMISTTYLDTAITPGATYHYQVKAVRLETSESGTYANQSLGEAVSITHGDATPGAPTRLTVTGTGTTTFFLTWDDNAPNAPGYEVQRRDETSGTWNTIATLIANSTSFTDSSAVAGVSNHYRVRALASPTNSAFSSEVSDPNPPGIARLAQDYTLVTESTATLPYGILRFSGSHGAAAGNWTTTDFVNSTGAFSGGGSGSVSWTHNQPGTKNVNFGITSFATPQLTKIFRVNLNSATGSALGTPTTGYVQIYDPTAQSLPSPWSSQAIGTVTQAGYAEHSAGSFGISAVTGSISSTADSYRSIHRTVTGDCRITARIAVRSTAASSTRAGIMIRSSLAADAVMCGAVTTSTTAIQRAYRTTTAGTADTALTQGSLALPLWLRLTRTGNNVALEYSSNGTAWTAFGTAVALANLGASPSVSLVMASNTSTPAIYGYAQFDNVNVHTVPPTPVVSAATGVQPGEVALSWAAVQSAETYVIERSTSSGSGFTQIAQVSTPGFTDSALTVGLTYYYRLRADNPSFQSAFSTEASAAPLNPPTVDGWRYRHFGTSANTGAAADTADPDGDGFLNLFESVAGQSPLVASPAARPVGGRTNISGSEYLTLTFIRDTTLTGVTLRGESTNSLTGAWTQFDPLAPANQLSVQPNTPSAGLETITIKDVQAIPPGDARFLRLRATRP